MSLNTNTTKTGLAARMRAWMTTRGRKTFAPADVWKALDIPPGRERERVATVLFDFYRRGEVTRRPEQRKGRHNSWRYRYNHAWQPIVRAPRADTAYKAMRVLSYQAPFAISDIVRTTDGKRSHIEKLARDLVRRGYLEKLGRRPRANSCGVETLYRIIDTDKFYLEVMK